MISRDRNLKRSELIGAGARARGPSLIRHLINPFIDAANLARQLYERHVRGRTMSLLWQMESPGPRLLHLAGRFAPVNG